MERLSADEARLVALWAQGFVEPIEGASPATVRRMGSARRVRLVHSMLRHLGAVQLDTISVLARSHELVAYARLGALGRGTVEDAYWDEARSFEYWSHAACLLPIESWPLFAFRRRYFARRGVRWHDVEQSAIQPVLDRLADGALSTGDIGGAKKGGQWWDWSDSKIAIEWLLDIGTVVVTRRVGWRREYDLASRVVPAALREDPSFVDQDGIVGPTDDYCTQQLIGESGRVMGVGTAADIADVHRLSRADVERHAADAGLVPAEVDGWKGRAWVTSEALEWLGSRSRPRHRTTLLSPFDSLVWHRPRAERIFGMSHRLEAYTPAHKRVHGYFAMPVLHRGLLVARVDPKRVGRTLHARRVTLESSSRESVRGTALALHEAASWVGADDVVVDDVVPASAASALKAAVAHGG